MDVHVRSERGIESKAFAEIRGLVVDEKRRGEGIGERLVTEAVHWAGGRGLTKCGVRCNIMREGAHRFYERQGFTLAKTQAVYDRENPVAITAVGGIAWNQGRCR